MTEATGCPTRRRRPARCTPAGTTATPPCCSAPPSISPRRATSTAPRSSSSSPPKRAARGGKAMVDDGLMERWGIQEVFGMHNMPGLPVGQFALRPGPLLAASDRRLHRRHGQGRPRGAPARVRRHRAGRLPHRHRAAVDRVAQRRSSAGGRDLDLHAARGRGRERDPGDGAAQGHRPLARRRPCATSSSGASSRWPRRRPSCHGATAKATYIRSYPVTFNHERQTAFAAGVAAEVAGADKVDANIAPLMGGEDFSFMLEARPGAIILLGNGRHRRRAPSPVRLQRRRHPRRRLLLGPPRRDRHARVMRASPPSPRKRGEGRGGGRRHTDEEWAAPPNLSPCRKHGEGTATPA